MKKTSSLTPLLKTVAYNMSAQLGCLQPSSPLSRERSHSLNQSHGKSKREPKTRTEKQVEAGSVTNTLNRTESVHDPSAFFTDHHFIRGKTLTFLLPSTSFLLFRTPPYDCYGPGWGVKIEESICQQLETLITQKIGLYFYSHLTSMAKNFGWSSNHSQRKPSRTFYQCQLDKQWSEAEQHEVFDHIVQKPIKACYFTAITWPEEEQWRCKLVNLRAFSSVLDGQKFYMDKQGTMTHRTDEQGGTNPTSLESKSWTVMGGDL